MQFSVHHTESARVCVCDRDPIWEMQKLQIWFERPRYFAAAIATHYAEGSGVSVGGGGGWLLVLSWLMAGLGKGGVKPKVSSSLNHGLLQYYFAPFPKACAILVWPGPYGVIVMVGHIPPPNLAPDPNTPSPHPAWLAVVTLTASWEIKSFSLHVLETKEGKKILPPP